MGGSLRRISAVENLSRLLGNQGLILRASGVVGLFLSVRLTSHSWLDGELLVFTIISTRACLLCGPRVIVRKVQPVGYHVNVALCRQSLV